MLRKAVLPIILVLMMAMLVACAPESEAPAAEPTSAPQAAEVAAEPTAEPAAEAEAEPTAEATEEATEEAEAEPTAEATEEATEEAAADGETAVYAVDTAASVVEWYGFKPVGGSEAGTVNIASGEMSFAGDQFVAGSFVIDMTSIDTNTQSGGMAEQLLGHLNSDDFFGVETYPTATLMIKSATPTDVENQYTVVGDLTIKSITNEIEFVTDVVVGEGTMTATSELIVNRADFDVRYGSGTFFSNLGNDLISDDMEMTVTLVANQN
ncbi:YceI family protein [bacterium]|nr:YceI family protein [bacterium]